ncbi:hypothetical protein AGMMS49992_29370 [Clostridia bacterium]|nr:hypothetical protein AGMMS49992_29370 [Clostridia bacterium]
MTLKEARQEAKLTQREVAQRARVPLVTYQRYECNRQKPHAMTAIRIADVLKESVETLFGTDESYTDMPA